jgi:hypothetical protein
MTSVPPRKGMPSPRLSREQFQKRFLAQFPDPAFRSLDRELVRIAEVAWEAYEASRKSPITIKAGNGFHDPNYDLSADWIQAKASIDRAQMRFNDKSKPSVLIINASSRGEHTCPGEMSKSYRLSDIARSTLLKDPDFEVSVLDLSRLASEYGRNIHPAKPAFRRRRRCVIGRALVIPTIRSARHRIG